MKIKELCKNILDLYEKSERDNKDKILALQLIYKLKLEIDSIEFSNNDLIPILETAKKIASTKKNFKQKLEKELLSLISFLPHALWMDEGEEEKFQKFERHTKTNEGQIAESLVNFAKEIYEINLDRDSFSGKRRVYSIQILENLSSYFEVPEFIELCLKSLKSKSKIEFLGSLECLEDNYKETNKVPNKDIIEIIDKRIIKTKDRVEITSGLNLQVVTGLISEFEALSRLDEWKEKNDIW